MCSCTHLVFLAHLLGLAAGLMFIRELVRLEVPAWMLAVGAGAVTLVMGAFVFHVSNPLQYFADFHKAYWPAGAAIWSGPGALEQVLRAGAFGFVNMPVVAYLFAPFGLLPPHVSALVFLVLSIASTVVAWRLLVGAAGLDESAKWTLAFLFAAFGPLLYSIREGNTTHMVLALLVWAFLLLRERRDLLAGAVLGFAALIKLPLLLFGIYYLLRGRWQVVAGGAGLLGLASLLSLAIFGWDMHVFWYETCIKPYAEEPIGALNVQSIAGALLRLEYGPQFILDWSRHQLSPASRIIASASTFVLLGLAAAAALAPRPRTSRLVARETAEELEFLIVLMLACIASPLTWSHYYTWMLMPAAFFIGRTPHFPPGLMVRVVGWGAIVLASIPVTLWMPGNALVAEIYARLVVSQLLFGGLVMLGLLMWSRWTMRSEADQVLVRAGAPAPA